MKKSINSFIPGSRFPKAVWRIILVLLTSPGFALMSLGQGHRDSHKMVITGVVSDAVNGRLIDSVSVSAAGVTTRSNAQGVFALAIPTQKIPVPKSYQLTFSRKNFNNLKQTVSADNRQRIEARMRSPYPLRNILHLFTDPRIPERGPHESPPRHLVRL